MNKKHKILIIDDEQTSRDILRTILANNNDFITEEAETGEQALTLMECFRPDVILLDVILPGINGHMVCSQIRNNAKHKYAKIIMISGRATPEERLSGYESGADDYIVKPFHADEILAKIKVFTRLKQTEEVEKIKSSLLSLFSHETKTPLNSVIMGCWHLLDDESIGKGQKATIKMILKSAKRLNGYADKVYRLCQLKKGKSLDLMPTLASDFIGFAAKQAQKNFNGKINCIFPDTSAKVNVDCRLFGEALQAVIDNAVKFSPQNGVITITCKNIKEMIQIEIADQGNGIPQELADSVFDEFSVGNILNHKEGAGLSLAIGRIIMEQHGGDLTLESTSSSGSVFKFRLPAQQ